MDSILRCIGLLVLVHGCCATLEASEALSGQCSGSACQSESEKAASLLQRATVTSPSEAPEEDPLTKEEEEAAALKKQDPEKITSAVLLESNVNSSWVGGSDCTSCPEAECGRTSYSWHASICTNTWKCKSCPKCYGCNAPQPAAGPVVATATTTAAPPAAPLCPKLPDGVESCADTDLGETWFSRDKATGGIDPTMICRSLGYDGASSSNCKASYGWTWQKCVTTGGGWCSSMAEQSPERYARSIWRQSTFQCVGGAKTCEGESACPVLFYSEEKAIATGQTVADVTTVDDCALSCHKTAGCTAFKYKAGGDAGFECAIHDPAAGALSLSGGYESCVKID